MTYIVDPSVLYWIGVLNIISSVAVACAIFGLIIAVIVWVVYWESGEESDYLRGPRVASVIMLAVGLLAAIFTPSKETMIAMLVAKTATVENVGFTIDTLKEAVDYIVEAIARIKG